jgi:hypothetical protein
MRKATALVSTGLLAASIGGFVSCKGETTERDPVLPDATSCGADCQTDLGAARAELEAGNFQAAFDLYQCADTPEAAFGAGLTRFLIAFEGPNADALMADLGLSLMRDVVRAGADSLQSGRTAFPHMTPTLTFDLRTLFGQPRDPRQVSAPVLYYEQECDEFECWSSTGINTAFLQEYFAGSIDADWENGSYDWSGDEAASDAIEEMMRSIGNHVVLDG